MLTPYYRSVNRDFNVRKHHWFWRGCNNEMENNFRKPFGYVT